MSAEKTKYIERLKLIASLSKLFSDSTRPYLYYRVAENIFSDSFNSRNVGRSDIAIDAVTNKTGVGLKTFTGHKGGSSYQKVAEFNASKPELDEILRIGSVEDFVIKLSDMRNARIDFAINAFELEDTIYHSVVRDVNRMSIIEEPMNKININNLKEIKRSDKTISFTDGLDEYRFMQSKSTLFKKFHESSPLYTFEVKILEDPFAFLGTQQINAEDIIAPESEGWERVILPLYSTQHGLEYGTVAEKSGINQWNAGGRVRDLGEAYIPVPSWIHKKFSEFFPPRDTPFEVELISGRKISMKICQEGGKALMSNPNRVLGEWIFKQVLKLPQGQIVTRELLDRVGIDSVEVAKSGDSYKLAFKQTGSFEEFREVNS